MTAASESIAVPASGQRGGKRPPRVSGGLPLLGQLLELRRAPLDLFWRVRNECGEVGEMRWAGQRVVMFSGEEAHDGIPATTALDRPAVQIMNLHKAKGLEAPVVFLADPTGRSEHPVTMHVDRSGDGTRGFLAMGQGSGYAWRTLAQPSAI